MGLLLLSTLFFILVTCKKKDDSAAPLPVQNDTLISTSGKIGTSGGQLVLPDGTTLIIPANALSEDISITVFYSPFSRPPSDIS